MKIVTMLTSIIELNIANNLKNYRYFYIFEFTRLLSIVKDLKSSWLELILNFGSLREVS